MKNAGEVPPHEAQEDASMDDMRNPDIASAMRAEEYARRPPPTVGEAGRDDDFDYSPLSNSELVELLNDLADLNVDDASEAALREAGKRLASLTPATKPVAWLTTFQDGSQELTLDPNRASDWKKSLYRKVTPLYASPAAVPAQVGREKLVARTESNLRDMRGAIDVAAEIIVNDILSLLQHPAQGE